MDLDSSLYDAIIAAKSMRAHGALRRQKQLIGKLMRSADVDAIRAALESNSASEVREKRDFRLAEAWRDRLLKDDTGALAELKTMLGGDTKEIERLLHDLDIALSDREQKRLKRELFRTLREALNTAE